MRAALDAFAQALAGHVCVRDPRAPLAGAVCVDVDEMRVLERRGDVRFLLEARAVQVLLDGREQLERDRAVQGDVRREQHDAETALAEHPLDAELTGQLVREPDRGGHRKISSGPARLRRAS